MHRLTRTTLSAVTSVALATAAFAEDLDLAKQRPGDVIVVPIPPGRTATRVINRVPTRTYRVTVVLEDRDIPPLESVRVPPGGLAAREVCQRLLAKAETLRGGTKTEVEVGRIVDEIRAEIGDCKVETIRADIEAELQNTIIDLGEYDVPAGSQLTVTVTRPDDAGQPLTWTKTLQTAERGRWLTLYGFGAVPSLDDRYYLDPVGEGKFTITQEDKRYGFKAVPSVFFMWLPRSRQGRNWSHGFTAGFGVKDDQPALSAGYSALYNWNLGLVAGVSLSRELRLNGRYKSPQEVMENIAEDALHQRVLQPRLMAALVFRFGSNPFATSDKTDSQPTKTKAGDETKPK